MRDPTVRVAWRDSIGMRLLRCGERLSLVIGDQAQVFDLVERLAQLDGDAPGLYQMKTERRDESIVSPCELGFHRRSRGNQGRAGGIEHCVVGTIAGAVRIAPTYTIRSEHNIGYVFNLTFRP